MKSYIIKSKIKTYKITEDGKIYVKRNIDSDNSYTEYIHSYNQIHIGKKFYNNKKDFFYELYHNCKVKKNERVIFKNKSQDFSKSNLVLVRRKLSDPKFFKKTNKKILFYDVKNNLIDTYNSQNECFRKTGIVQTVISKSLIYGIRRMDGSYFIYEDEKLKPIPKNISLKNNKKDSYNIIQLDLDGKVINKFDNIKRAIDYLGLDNGCTSHIVKCCKLKRKSAYGYMWRYADTLKTKKMKSWICYYENGVLKEITSSRKEMCKKIDISKFHISNILSKKHIPKKYSIIEVSYEAGLNLKKKMDLDLAA